MAKWADASVLDAILDKVATSTTMFVTTSQPANRAAAVTAALATVSVSSGDFAKSAGTPNGRKLTIAQKSNIAVTATGSSTHVCLADATTLLYVTTVTAQTLTSGNTVTVPAWTITESDPS